MTEDILVIENFIVQLNNLIDSNFALADYKIRQVMNYIKNSEVICKIYSKYMGEQTEYQLNEIIEISSYKNPQNNGMFVPPRKHKDLVKFVITLLLYFDTNKINLFDFLIQNFPNPNKNESYKEFLNTILVPFREEFKYIAEELNNGTDINDVIEKQINLIEEPVVNTIEDVNEEVYESDYYEEPVVETKQDLSKQELEVLNDIISMIKELRQIIDGDRKIKKQLKERMQYILNGILYSARYKDLTLLSIQFASFELAVGKVRSIEPIMADIESKMINFFETKNNQQN